MLGPSGTDVQAKSRRAVPSGAVSPILAISGGVVLDAMIYPCIGF
jgi:hypothetical protein